MDKELQKHEKFLLKSLQGLNQENRQILLIYSKNKIEFFQHERLIHLLVTLAFALFFIISIITAVIYSIITFALLSVLFLVLLIPYIVHYYRLENGVQRLYKIYDELYNMNKLE